MWAHQIPARNRNASTRLIIHPLYYLINSPEKRTGIRIIHQLNIAEDAGFPSVRGGCWERHVRVGVRMALFNRTDRRKITPESIWEPIRALFSEHATEVLQSDNPDYWSDCINKWNIVFDNIRDQQEGGINGTIKTIDHLRDVEKLAVDDDPYIRLASAVIAQPFNQDFYNHAGFHDLVEDFVLHTYKRVPVITDTGCKHDVRLIFPPWYERILTGYPSPRRVARDFKRLLKGSGVLGFKL